MLSISPSCLGRRLCINLGFDLCKIDLLEHVLSGNQATESTARRWSRQLIAAIGHVHACNVAHLDVKLENMFLDHRGVLKLGDMGLAAVLAPGERTQKMCGSGVYAAPEVILSSSAGPYDGRSADIWSVGVSMFVMVRGRFPFQLKHPTQLYTAFVETQKIAAASGSLPMPAPAVLSSRSQREGFSVSLLHMLDAALALDPADRPTAEHLAAAPWLREHDEQLGDRKDDNTACVATEATTPASADGDTQVLVEPGKGYTTPEVSPRVVPRKVASNVAGDTISTRLYKLQVASSKPTTTLKVMAPWNSNAAESSPGGMRRSRQPEQRVMPYKRAKGASALSIRTKC